MWLIIHIKLVLGLLHRVVVRDVADISEMAAAFTLKMEAVATSETAANIPHSTTV
jgi:hypothetical protein